MGSLSRGGTGNGCHKASLWSSVEYPIHSASLHSILDISSEIRNSCVFYTEFVSYSYFKIVCAHFMLDECYNRVKCGIRTCQLLLIEKNKAQRDLNDFPKFTRNCKFLEGKGYLT